MPVYVINLHKIKIPKLLKIYVGAISDGFMTLLDTVATNQWKNQNQQIPFQLKKRWFIV